MVAREPAPACGGPGLGSVLVTLREPVILRWANLAPFHHPAVLYHHRHTFEVMLGFEEGSFQAFIPTALGPGGSDRVLGICDHSPHAEFTIRAGRHQMVYTSWDCSETETTTLPSGLKEGCGDMAWNFEAPGNGQLRFDIWLRRQRSDGGAVLRIQGEVESLRSLRLGDQETP